MRKLSLLLIIALMAMAGCSKKTTRVLDTSTAKNLSPVGYLYALPKTGFEVAVESRGNRYTPGPYAQFAEKYLGIKGVATEMRTQWSIKDIRISNYLELDMKQLFVVEPSPSSRESILELGRNGLIMSVRGANFKEQSQQEANSVESLMPISHTDLSSTPFIVAERTTHVSRVFQDSTFVRVPVQKTFIVEKSIEDKAKEAADLIFSLRKRRLELIAGDADFVAEGKAVDVVFKEIARLEKDYLSLFIGINQSVEVTDFFTYVPTGESDSPVILFRFSATKGVLPISDLSGSPVLIGASLEDQWGGAEVLAAIASEKSKPRLDALYYRIPVPIAIRISFGPNELLYKRETAHQFGPLVRIPANYLE